MAYIERVIPEEVGLEVDEQLLSIHAMNPFITHLSSPRSIMFSSHLSQALTLTNGEEKIVQTGLEKQFGANTFSKKIENDARIISIIKRYDGIDRSSVTATTELVVIYEDLVTGEIDYVDMPNYFSLHQYFGFKYKWNEDMLSSLSQNTIVPGGTIFADSPSVASNSGYKWGINANVALLTIPEVAEDGMVISESLAKKLSYKVFERRVVEFGSESFPLNIYGDENDYKPFPEIGERIADHSVLMALRKYDSELSPALTSTKDVMEFNPMFDEAVYVKGGGGLVVDIKAYYNPRFKKAVYNGASDKVDKYVNGLKKFNKDLMNVYDKLVKDHYSRYHNNNLSMSEKLNKLLLDAYVSENSEDNKVRFTYKNEEMDIYRMEFVIENEISSINIGSKLTDLTGAKGVVVEIRPDHLMPVDAAGNIADLITDPTSISSRMNIGRLYEQYFNASSRHTKKLVIDFIQSLDTVMDPLELLEIMTPKETIAAFDIVLGLLKIIDTEQYVGYANLVKTNNIYSIKEILHEIVTKELFIYYKVSSKKKAYQIVTELRDTIYAAPISKSFFNKNGTIVAGKSDMFIAPMYIMLLFKTGDEYLSVASAKTNHYNFPIGVSKNAKNRLPWRSSPTKILSETESRLVASYTSRLALAELKDRANSIDTHRIIYSNILNADKPTNIDVIVDRDKHPYGTDAGIQLIDNIFNCAGIELAYTPE